MSKEENISPKDDFEEVVEELKHSEPQEMGLAEDSAFTDLLPNMTINQTQDEEKCIIEDTQLLGIYDEILKNCRDDRRYIDEVLANFINMVMGDSGDATSASKEAIVNLMKIRSDTSDKMAKVADLMTRIKLKDKDTFPRYLAAHQHNNVTIESSKRDLIKKIQHEIKKKG